MIARNEPDAIAALVEHVKVLDRASDAASKIGDTAMEYACNCRDVLFGETRHDLDALFEAADTAADDLHDLAISVEALRAELERAYDDASRLADDLADLESVSESYRELQHRVLDYDRGIIDRNELLQAVGVIV